MKNKETEMNIYLGFSQINQIQRGELEATKTVGFAFPPGKKTKSTIWMATNKEGEIKKDKNGLVGYNVKSSDGVEYNIYLDHTKLRAVIAKEAVPTTSIGYARKPGASKLRSVFLATDRETQEVKYTEKGYVRCNIVHFLDNE